MRKPNQRTAIAHFKLMLRHGYGFDHAWRSIKTLYCINDKSRVELLTRIAKLLEYGTERLSKGNIPPGDGDFTEVWPGVFINADANREELDRLIDSGLIRRGEAGTVCDEEKGGE